MQITTEMLRNDIEELKKQSTLESMYILEAYQLALVMQDDSPPSVSVEEKPTLADVFEHYYGTKEYNGIVAVIQRWYYGSLVKDSWCATSLSWCLAQLGLMAHTIGKKYENVYHLYNALVEHEKKGNVSRETYESIKRGDIVIFKWEDKFAVNSKKHVSVYTGFKIEDVIECIGGNQDDAIMNKGYKKENIVAIFRPQYEKGTLSSVRYLPDA